MRSHNRIEVMHGVNLDQLGRRDPGHYGGLTFDRLEQTIQGFAAELGLQVRFFQTNVGAARLRGCVLEGAAGNFTYPQRTHEFETRKSAEILGMPLPETGVLRSLANSRSKP